MPKFPPFSRQQRQTGMTLIEVMVGFTLVATLMVGMNMMWSQINLQADRQILKQKAIFRLHGEMERLDRLYAAGTLATSGTCTSDCVSSGGYLDHSDLTLTNDGAYLEVPDSRWVYDSGGAAPYAVQGETVDPEGTATELSKLNDIYRKIHVVGAGASTRNYVWLDRRRNILGRLSWHLYINDSGSGALSQKKCSTSSQYCALLTLFIDYPLRATLDGSDVITGATEISEQPVESLTLQTIVGQLP